MSTLTPLGNTSLTKFDVLVIGSGAGGSAVTHVLAKAGLKVLVLEAGPSRFLHLDDPSRDPVALYSNDELKYERGFVDVDARIEPRGWRTDDTQQTIAAEVNALPKVVGGGTAHADLKTPRFQPTDFRLGTLIGAAVAGASFADWPISYDMLEPFYAYAEKVMGVQGLAGSDPFAGPRSGAFPMPPGPQMYASKLVAAGLAKLGYTPFPYPGAVNSVPFDGRPACVDCGFCGDMACPSNAKGTPPVTTLRKALLTGNVQLLPETRAARLLMNGAKDTVVGVEAILPDGTRRTFTADRYVLAASPIEDARLLHLSDPDVVGNSSGQVGRNLMFHLETSAVGIFEERVHGHRGRVIDTGFSDFRGVPNDPAHPLAGIVEISGSEHPINEAGYVASILKPFFGFDGARFKKLLRQGVFRDHIVPLTIQAEDAPQPTNRVDLDPNLVDLDGLPVARVTYKSHAWELAAAAFYGPKLIDILGAAGAKWAALTPPSDIPDTAHIMGTLRFGADPTTSVCDATGRFHDVSNLYSADGALFPTSSGFNPTLTIVALAMRVAGEMAYPGSPERAIA